MLMNQMNIETVFKKTAILPTMNGENCTEDEKNFLGLSYRQESKLREGKEVNLRMQKKLLSKIGQFDPDFSDRPVFPLLNEHRRPKAEPG